MAAAHRLENGVSDPAVHRIGAGAYLVSIDGRREIVHVATAGGTQWAHVRGEVFRMAGRDDSSRRQASKAGAGRDPGALPITAPMPAKVLKVIATPGAAVTKGETLVILEAMKMELPLRASGDGVVVAVHCREGELVQPDTVLVELS